MPGSRARHLPPAPGIHENLKKKNDPDAFILIHLKMQYII
jgi:hypothetical protein